MSVLDLPDGRRRRWIIGATVALILVSGVGIAAAYWLSTDSSNYAGALADTLPQGATPTASVITNSSTVNLSFAQTSSAGGLALTGYDITRYPASGGSGTAVSASCAGSPTVTCTVASQPDGAWKYTDKPKIAGSSWVGSESTLSNTVTVDTTPPTVTNVTSTAANGSFGPGAVIPVTVTFSELVNVTGTPQLTLSTGSPSTTAVSYSSGSGTATLTFNYTVVAGNTSTDLNYAATTSLALNGGTIRDAATNNATLTLPGLAAAGSLGTNKDIVIDTTPPTVTNVTSATANGAYGVGVVIPVTVTFSESVNVTGTPQLTLSTGSPVTTAVSYASGSGSTVLTFNYTVAAGNTSADLNYAATTSLALNGGTIRDAATNNATLTLPGLAAAGSLGTNRNIVIDTTAPTVSSINRAAGSTNPTNTGPLSWTVTFSEPVSGVTAANFTLATSGTGGTAPTIASVTPSSGAPTATWTVTASVTGTTGTDAGSIGLNKPAASNAGVTDAAGNGLTGGLLTGQAFTYDTTPPSVAITSMSDGGGNKKVTVSGTASNGTGFVTVHLCQVAGCSSGTAVETLNVTPSGGSWSLTGANHAGGNWWSVAVYSDAAGNTTTTPVFGPFFR